MNEFVYIRGTEWRFIFSGKWTLRIVRRMFANSLLAKPDYEDRGGQTKLFPVGRRKVHVRPARRPSLTPEECARDPATPDNSIYLLLQSSLVTLIVCGLT